MDRNHKALIQFVLEKAEAEKDLSRRASVYRGLAGVIGDADEEARLNHVAENLERSQVAISSLQLKFY